MEPEGSLPCWQEPAAGPCPEPDESSPQYPTLFLLISITIILPSIHVTVNWARWIQSKSSHRVYLRLILRLSSIYVQVSVMVSFLYAFWLKFCMHCSSVATIYFSTISVTGFIIKF
jgi:hypothetical protein